MDIDFRAYHYRAINAKSEDEKQAINQELKDLYAALDEESKMEFNAKLQSFLVSEYAKIASMSQQIQKTDSEEE